MISPIHFLWGLLAVAVIALIVNLKFKLPKKLFLAIIVMTVVTVCWVAMEGDGSKTPRVKQQANPIKVLAEQGSFNPGENDFSIVDKNFLCSNFCCSVVLQVSKDYVVNPTNYEGSLHFSNGESIKNSGAYLSNKEIKFIFVVPERMSMKEVAFLRVSLNVDSPVAFSQIFLENICN